MIHIRARKIEGGYLSSMKRFLRTKGRRLTDGIKDFLLSVSAEGWILAGLSVMELIKIADKLGVEISMEELEKVAHISDHLLVHMLASEKRVAKPWGKLPKGWDKKSLEKYWDSLTGDVKHKVTKCIDRMKGHIDDPGAFCASLADKVTGTTKWRNKDWKKKHMSSEQRDLSEDEELARELLSLAREMLES